MELPIWPSRDQAITLRARRCDPHQNDDFHNWEGSNCWIFNLDRITYT